jgi:hypothetical protein
MCRLAPPTLSGVGNKAVFLRHYRFEHRTTERSITLQGWSYLWAGLLGAGYVWWIGYGSVLQAAAVNLAFAIGVVAIALGTSVLPSFQQLVVIVAVVPLAIFIQGKTMVSIIREGFRRRGWLITVA